MTKLVFLVSFLLAFLLFSVQPMATKMVLPSLGGTPAVWNTAMVTFQLLLLAGYAYAHFLTAHLKPRAQWLVHAAIIAASCIMLPLIVSLPEGEALFAHPITHLTSAFVLQLGLPFFVLAATAPLLQSWVSRSTHPLSQKPYVLYSASNMGSLMALIGYVVVIEPSLNLAGQSWGWSALYIAGVSAMLLVGCRLNPQAAEVVPTTTEEVPPKTYALWILLAALPSALCLGVTSYISTDLASLPLLWIVPLALYLLSFVDAFSNKPRLVKTCIRIAPLTGLMALALYMLNLQQYPEQFLFHIVAFTVLSFALNGWLAEFKPAPKHLTRFYFCLSLGGAVGGILNALVAPLIFQRVLEYPITLLVSSFCAFILWQTLREPKPESLRWHMTQIARVAALMVAFTLNIYLISTRIKHGEWQLPFDHVDPVLMLRSAGISGLITFALLRRYACGFYACGMVFLLTLAMVDRTMGDKKNIYTERNFFGVTRVVTNGKANYLMHNTTMHGYQGLGGGPLIPTEYYAYLHGIYNLPVAREHPLAVIGLGAGTMKCYAHPGQRMDFFEINPVSVKVAENAEYFRFLKHCPGDYRVLLGDGRIMLGKQDAQYGVIALDAFSSDAIPAHLLTTEALQLYLTKLAPGGVMAFHTSNRYLDLWPLLASQAKALGLVAYGRAFKGPDSYWIVLARSDEDIFPLVMNDAEWKSQMGTATHRPWTDQYSNMLPYFRHSK